jgi:hypothetical protein
LFEAGEIGNKTNRTDLESPAKKLPDFPARRLSGLKGRFCQPSQ